MKDYTTPKIDAVLLEEGWWRPNEASLYVKKNDDPVWSHKIVFTWEGFCDMESWFENDKRIISDEEMKRIIVTSLGDQCLTLIKDNITPQAILLLTADFYYHTHDMNMHEKYVNIYNKFTGRKYPN